MAAFLPWGYENMAYVHDHPAPQVSVIIPVFNKLELTRTCIRSIHDHGAEASFEIIVVDNGSSDGSGPWLAAEMAEGRLRVVSNPENGGFSRGCNLGAEAAQGKDLLFLNNDMEVKPDWLDPLVTTLDHDPSVGIVGAKLLFPDGTIQHGGVAMLEVRDEVPSMLGGHHLSYTAAGDDPPANRAQQMQVVTGACLLIRREIFTAIGGFDEGYWNGNEDVDLCLKAGEKGWKVVYRPESEIIHFESQSGQERWSKLQPNIERFNAIWKGRAHPDFIKTPDFKFERTPHCRIGPYVAPSLRVTGEGPRTSVVVLVWNALDYVKRCADSLLRHTAGDCELIFVDNGSDRPTQDYLRALDGANDRVRAIFNGENLGFAAGNNVGIAAARGRYVCLLNSDTVVTAGWLDRLVAVCEADPLAGLAGPVTNSITGGQRLPEVGYDQTTLEGLDGFAADLAAAQGGRIEQALWIVGFCVLIRRDLIEKIGGLDDRFGRGNYEDTDYCLRAFLAGYKAVVARDSFVHHFGSRSFVDGKVDYDRELDEKFEIFRRKWNLDPTARQSGNLDLERLVAEGFVPALHFHPLPESPLVKAHPLRDWEAARWLARGEDYYAQGRLGEAERMFRAVHERRPDLNRAANDLAVVIWRQDPEGPGLDEARGILAAVLARDPGDEDALWNLEQMAAPVTV